MKYSTYLRKNLTSGDFRNYSLQNGMENCLNKIIHILTKKNKDIIFIWNEKNKNQFNSGRGFFGYTIIGTILINGKDYSVLFNWRDNYQYTTSFFKINGVDVIELTKEVTVWDAGCSTTAGYLKIYDEIDNILK